jgi:hypothetical protein
MRTLLIGAMAATLVGCSCFPSPQVSMEACSDVNGFACFDRTAEGQPFEPKPTSFKTSSAKIKVKSTTAARAEKPPSAHARDGDVAMKTAKPAVIAVKVDSPASGQPAESPDPVIVKAKTTIAAKLEDPTSAEFGEMKRAVRKNTLGQSVDTICGRVKGKKASGEDTGDRPFLYLVKDDDAYVVVDGPAGLAAASAYRNICN